MVVLWEDHYLLHLVAYMVKMENGVVIQSKPIFYRRFVDNIYNRRTLEAMFCLTD